MELLHVCVSLHVIINIFTRLCIITRYHLHVCVSLHVIIYTSVYHIIILMIVNWLSWIATWHATAAFLKATFSAQYYSPPLKYHQYAYETQIYTQKWAEKSTQELVSAPMISRAASFQSPIGFYWTGFSWTPTRLKPLSSVRDNNSITANSSIDLWHRCQGQSM